MQYLTTLSAIIMFCCNLKAAEPNLEWTIRYMVREVPGGITKRAFRDAREYDKHRKDFIEQMSITIQTVGFKEAAAKACSRSGTASLALIPLKDGKIRLIANFQEQETAHLVSRLIDPGADITYGEEKVLGGGGSAELDKQNPGLLINARATSVVLIVRKVDKRLSKGLINLAEETLELGEAEGKQRRRKKE